MRMMEVYVTQDIFWTDRNFEELNIPYESGMLWP